MTFINSAHNHSMGLSRLLNGKRDFQKKTRMEKTEHVRSEKRQIEGGMGGTKMTIKPKKV